MSLSMDLWKNEVAVVTGASSGIGEAISKSLVEDGVKVVGFARRIERLETLAKQLNNKKGTFHYTKVDVTKEEEVVAGFKWVTENVGPIHILINNAGILNQNSLIGDASVEKWRQILETNVIGLSICTREAVNIMNAKNIDGYVIHINSLSGHRVPPKSSNHMYPPSKHAVTALRTMLDGEIRQMGKKIRVTSISPGLVQTEIGQADGIDMRAFKERYDTALKPEDVADAVRYVLSTPARVTVRDILISPSSQEF